MRRKDWRCKKCGAIMVRGDRYLYCMGDVKHGKLVPAWGIKDLPFAIKIDYKRYKICGEPGYWEYVSHAHKNAMNVAPEPGHIVAKVPLRWGRNRWDAARSFRKSKPPRRKC